MNIHKLVRTIKAGVAALAVILAISLSVTSCKGRTMDNMVPSGDTVEVVPDTLDSHI